MISFYVETQDGNPLSANEVVEYLRQKLRVDASLLSFSVASLKTTVCQNNCSGHGVCDEQTRDCICEAFWMRVVEAILSGLFCSPKFLGPLQSLFCGRRLRLQLEHIVRCIGRCLLAFLVSRFNLDRHVLLHPLLLKTQHNLEAEHLQADRRHGRPPTM